LTIMRRQLTPTPSGNIKTKDLTLFTHSHSSVFDQPVDPSCS
jgi:hypothetical protein